MLVFVHPDVFVAAEEGRLVPVLTGTSADRLIDYTKPHLRYFDSAEAMASAGYLTPSTAPVGTVRLGRVVPGSGLL